MNKPGALYMASDLVGSYYIHVLDMDGDHEFLKAQQTSLELPHIKNLVINSFPETYIPRTLQRVGQVDPGSAWPEGSNGSKQFRFDAELEGKSIKVVFPIGFEQKYRLGE